MRVIPIILTVAALLATTGCRDRPRGTTSQPAHAEVAAGSPAPTNRIDVPASVRQNLGITFAKVERRRVSSTIRVPGRFELLPSARREYRSTLPGWVHLLVDQYDDVKKGTPLGELDSPEWHKIRKQLHESQATIARVGAEVEVATQARIEAEKTADVMQRRIDALAGVEVRRAELEADLAATRNSLPRLAAEIEVKRAALNEAKHDFALEVDTAAALLGIPPKTLTEEIKEDGHGDGDHGIQRWYGINRISVSAVEPGVVEALHATNGSWVEANTLIATVIDPAAVRFHATGLQSDLGRLKDGLACQVVPPQGSGIAPGDTLPGKLKVGLVGDADARTVELLTTSEKLAAWAKPGVSAMLEVVAEGGTEELAIPASAVVRDELTHIFFRRDPSTPDKVIRIEADLGVSDGKWVVVNSGVKEGDEVVLEGVYELKLAGGGKATGGGHFHADGTWHAEEEK